MKVSPARDAPTPEEMSPFAPYRGPLVDSVTTEVVPPKDTPPPSPFVRLMEGDVGYEELRALTDAILGSESGDTVTPQPRAAANEDSATYETKLSEFEEWVRKMDRENPDDDPPDGGMPDSQVQRHDDDDEQDTEEIAA